MEAIQGKPIGEALAREPQFYTATARETNVSEPDPTKYLRIALRLVGVAFIVGIYTFINVWPSGWSWHAGQSHHLPHYLQMILGVYATLGVFLLIASRNPLAHLSLIWFTVWSSVVHAAASAQSQKPARWCARFQKAELNSQLRAISRTLRILRSR
jgi:hypothetical protein